jgi:hypothetical protein
MMRCNFTRKQPDGIERVCALTSGHGGSCVWSLMPTAPPYDRDARLKAFDRGRALSMAVAFVAGVLLAHLLGGCGRVNYEPTGDAGETCELCSELVGTWEREATHSACAQAVSFDAGGAFVYTETCDDSERTLSGRYKLDGAELELEPTDSEEPAWAASVELVDGYALELDGLTYYRKLEL